MIIRWKNVRELLALSFIGSRPVSRYSSEAGNTLRRIIGLEWVGLNGRGEATAMGIDRRLGVQDFEDDF